MVNVTRSIVEDDSDITTIKLFYANKTYEDILFKSELKELSQYWNFTLKHFISQVMWNYEITIYVNLLLLLW